MYEDCYSMNFDQYFRYRAVAEVINSLGRKGLTILDVGGGSGKFLEFLKDHKAVSTDKKDGIDGTELPYKDNSFDIVTSIDALEHVPVEGRAKFIQEIIRVAKFKVVLAFPHEAATEATQFVARITKMRGPIKYWIKEHIENGLPSQEDIEKTLNQLPVNYSVKKNLDLGFWTIMTITDWYLPRKLRKLLNKEVNRLLYGVPVNEACYRLIYDIKIETDLQ